MKKIWSNHIVVFAVMTIIFFFPNYFYAQELERGSMYDLVEVYYKPLCLIIEFEREKKFLISDYWYKAEFSTSSLNDFRDIVDSLLSIQDRAEVDADSWGPKLLIRLIKKGNENGYILVGKSDIIQINDKYYKIGIDDYHLLAKFVPSIYEQDFESLITIIERKNISIDKPLL